jgi:hypothetical protein
VFKYLLSYNTSGKEICINCNYGRENSLLNQIIDSIKYETYLRTIDKNFSIPIEKYSLSITSIENKIVFKKKE